MFVIKFKDGKFCKFGSYKTFITVDQPYYATIYKDFNKVTSKLGFKSGGIVQKNVRFWKDKEQFGIEDFEIVYVKITWEAHTSLSFKGQLNEV